MTKRHHDDDDHRQPRDVSSVLRNYLEMTAARAHRKRHRRDPAERPPEPRPEQRDAPIDNEGLPLEEGNDFA